MIKKLNFKTFLTFLLLGVFMGTFSCKEDVLEVEDEAIISNEASSTSRRVNAADIPEIMQFVNEQTNGRLTYQLKGVPGTREPDLTVGQVQTANILQVTNPYNLSNYTFAMTKTEPDGELSFLNLVVKETATGVYSYIMKIRPDVNWFNNQTGTEMNMVDYTGDIILYTSEGIYVHKTTFSAGQPVSYETRDPCPNEGGGNNPPGGGGGNPPNGGTGNNPPSGGGNNPPPTGGGNNPPTGGGGGDPCIVIVIETVDCGGGQYCEIIHVYTCEDYFFNPLRTPCPLPTQPEECELQNDCEFGFDQDCNCLPDPNDPTNENNETGINLTQIPCEILSSLENNSDFKLILQDLKNKASTDNKETVYIMTGNVLMTGNYQYYDPYEGVESELGVNLTIDEGYKLSAMAHNHNNDAENRDLSIFSPADIYTLYRIIKFDNAESNSLFFSFLVTASGTVYALRVNNASALINFGDVNFFGWDDEDAENNSNSLNDEFAGKDDSTLTFPTGIKNSNTVEENELSFMKILDNTLVNIGLELYKADENFENWKKVELNYNQINYSNCN